jgi:hypothetical protein
MDVIKQVNGTVNDGLQAINGNRIASVVLGLFLALYASLAAPNLPSSVTKIFKNPFFKLGFMFLIAYMATKDTSVAIITAVALLVTLQTLSAHETTDAVVSVVNSKINSKIENFAAIPALATNNKYDDFLDYNLTNSDEHIYNSSGSRSSPASVSSADSVASKSSGNKSDKNAVEAKQHVFRQQLGGDTYNLIGQEMASTMPGVNVGPELVMQQPNKPVHNPSAKNVTMKQPVAEFRQPVVEMKSPSVVMKQPVVEMKQPVVEMNQQPIVVNTSNENEEGEPSFLDLITGFNNTGNIEPFSGSSHYDIEFVEDVKVDKTSHNHQIENFNSEVVGSCGADGGVGVAVPGFDLGEFASF